MLHPLIYSGPDAYLSAPRKAVALFGMSGLGKTHLAHMLRQKGDWFHYSIDYRIGTRYLGEAIVDNFKREAMRNPFLRELLRSDSIYIGSNISFQNLKPLSTFLGRPGSSEKGGIPFEEYVRRQRLHRRAEIAALTDTAHFIDRAHDIYGYSHFLCDTSGSICEVVDPADAEDPVLRHMAGSTLLVHLRGTRDDAEVLVERFAEDPKPMYYAEGLLREEWESFLAESGVAPEQADPNAFIVRGFRRILEHRLPIYARIAENWGVTVEASDLAGVGSPEDFDKLIATAIAGR